MKRAGVAREEWTAEEAERYLLGRERFGMRFELDRMRRLMNVLGLPRVPYPTIGVVGTNGKSSTTRMIAALLEREGMRTGCFTSPHLLSYRERIQIGEHDISPERFASAIGRTVDGAELVDRAAAQPGDAVTQFEMLTATAFVEFAEVGVDVAVLEAGLGGRYDATNVVDSRVAVLTNVGLEHTRYLGPTV
ncbi:MAG: bifunctional folylpolyglutamate synthase/dihydrofolate synthase, partial [Solirubrobacteraceae bacterium]